MEFDEFKQQFRARRRKAEQEHGELLREADSILKEMKPLVEVYRLAANDFRAGRWEEWKQKLRGHGFSSPAEIEERVRDLGNSIRDRISQFDNLTDELARRTVRCPDCGGLGHVWGKTEWVEGETGRIPYRKCLECRLCSGKGRFDVEGILRS